MKHKNLLAYIKMGEEILMFGDNQIEKNTFFGHKSPVPLRDVDIEKVLVSKKISLGEKTLSTLVVTCILVIKLSHYV